MSRAEMGMPLEAAPYDPALVGKSFQDTYFEVYRPVIVGFYGLSILADQIRQDIDDPVKYGGHLRMREGDEQHPAVLTTSVTVENLAIGRGMDDFGTRNVKSMLSRLPKRVPSLLGAEQYTIEDASEDQVVQMDDDGDKVLRGYRFFGVLLNEDAASFRAEQQSLLEAFGIAVSAQRMRRMRPSIPVLQVSSPRIDREDRDHVLSRIKNSHLAVVLGSARYRFNSLENPRDL